MDLAPWKTPRPHRLPIKLVISINPCCFLEKFDRKTPPQTTPFKLLFN